MSADRTTADPLEAALAILAPKHVTRDYRPADAAADAIRKEFARVQSALTPLPADTVCACLDETGERKVRHYERCERCHALMESDLPRDLRDVSVRMLAAEAGVEELQRALQETQREATGAALESSERGARWHACQTDLAALRRDVLLAASHLDWLVGFLSVEGPASATFIKAAHQKALAARAVLAGGPRQEPT